MNMILYSSAIYGKNCYYYLQIFVSYSDFEDHKDGKTLQWTTEFRKQLICETCFRINVGYFPSISKSSRVLWDSVKKCDNRFDFILHIGL